MQSNFVQYNTSYCSVQQYSARECTSMKDFEVGGLRVTRGNGGMSSGWGAWMVLPGEQPAQVPGNPDIYCNFTIQLKLNHSSSSHLFDNKNVHSVIE